MIPGPPPKRQRSGSHRQNTNLPDVEAPREESQIPDVIESPDKESKNPDTIETPKGDAKLSNYMAMPQRKKPKILIINPNTSKELTETMKRAVADANPKMHIDWYTAKEGPGSIDTNEDAQRSAEHVMKEVTSELSKYDGFLVACYCEHPLLEFLRTELPSAETPVLGIFKASIDAAMSIVSRDNSAARFGIVTNGEYWETVLHNGVKAYLGPGRYGAKFSGVKSAYIMVDKLEAMKAEEVAKIEAAVRWFLDDISISVIIMGCASMSGLEGVFEKALGANATGVQILDGVKCGIRELEKLLTTTREIIEKDPIEYWLQGVERAGEEEDGELDKKDLDGVKEVGRGSGQ
jgi:Asp/Glu/hydantoin racemase